MKIIIVDDEPLYIRYLTSNISWKEFDISVAKTFNSGKLALSYLNENNDIDAVLTDIKMPVLDGISLIKSVICTFPKMYFIVLSGYDDFDLVKAAFTNGAHDYILKMNINSTEFNEAIKKMTSYVKNKPLNDINIFQSEHTYENINDVTLTDEIINYIEKNYENDLSLTKISKHFNFSTGYISTIFSKKVGVTLIEYITIFRMNKAQYFLINSNMRISEISYRVGYNNVEHFSRFFKKHSKCSPSEYRKKQLTSLIKT